MLRDAAECYGDVMGMLWGMLQNAAERCSGGRKESHVVETRRGGAEVVGGKGGVGGDEAVVGVRGVLR